jgi:hypothetical protein
MMPRVVSTVVGPVVVQQHQHQLRPHQFVQMLTVHNRFKDSKTAMETLLAASTVVNAAQQFVATNNCALLHLTRVLIKIVQVLNLLCPNTVLVIPVAIVETHNALQDSCAMLNKALVLFRHVL